LDFLSADFLSALFTIIVIDLMLAGDNAIVIALAARNVPQHLQKRAILWGMLGAIAMRISMTLIVVWLLEIPGLLFIGGALLVWIAYRLLLPGERADEGHHVKVASSFWGAMRTIVVADAIMGLDNVLAVAGAAHGSFVLVVLGLLISVPIVIWGSSMILRYVERFPSIVYFGSGVLAWTAVKMMTAEPLLKGLLATNDAIVHLLYVLVVFAVLWGGFVKNHLHLESRINLRLAEFSTKYPDGMSATDSSQGERTMQKILVPVDGSPNSLYAIRHLIRVFMDNSAMEIHLVNVQRPFSRYVARFLSKTSLDNWYRDEAEKALSPCRKLLEQHGVPHSLHIEKGEKAEVIVAAAKRLNCDMIVMSTARKSSLTRMVEASVTNRVLELTTVPVEVIAGGEVSSLERYGIPTGIGIGVTALLMLALD
jgi:YjbE family integral membrane protein